MEKCKHCGQTAHPQGDDADLLADLPVGSEPAIGQPADTEAEDKTSILTELIELMQGSAGSRLKPEEEDEEEEELGFTKAIPATPITGTN